MVFNRSQAKAAFNHVLDNVLAKDDNSPLKQSLLMQGYDDVFHLVTIDNDSIAALVYVKSPTEIGIPVSMADKELVRAFVFYVRHVQLNNGYCGLNNVNDWMTMTQEGFDNYRTSHLCPVICLPNAVTTTPTISTTWTTERNGFVAETTPTTTVNFNETSDDDSTWPSMASTCTFRPDEHGVFVRISMSTFPHITELVREETTSLWGDTSESDDDVIDEALESTEDIVEMTSGSWVKELSSLPESLLIENAYDPQKVFQKEAVKHILGTSERVGPIIAEKLLAADTRNVLYWSKTRRYDIQAVNLRTGLFKGEDDPITSKIIKFRFDRFDKHGELGFEQTNTLIFSWQGLIGHMGFVTNVAQNRLPRSKPDRLRMEPAHRVHTPLDCWPKLSAINHTVWNAPKSGPTSVSTTKRHDRHDISAYVLVRANTHETAQDSIGDDLGNYPQALPYFCFIVAWYYTGIVRGKLSIHENVKNSIAQLMVDLKPGAYVHKPTVAGLVRYPTIQHDTAMQFSLEDGKIVDPPMSATSQRSVNLREILSLRNKRTNGSQNDDAIHGIAPATDTVTHSDDEVVCPTERAIAEMFAPVLIEAGDRLRVEMMEFQKLADDVNDKFLMDDDCLSEEIEKLAMSEDLLRQELELAQGFHTTVVEDVTTSSNCFTHGLLFFVSKLHYFPSDLDAKLVVTCAHAHGCLTRAGTGVSLHRKAVPKFKTTRLFARLQEKVNAFHTSSTSRSIPNTPIAQMSRFIVYPFNFMEVDGELAHGRFYGRIKKTEYFSAEVKSINDLAVDSHPTSCRIPTAPTGTMSRIIYYSLVSNEASCELSTIHLATGNFPTVCRNETTQLKAMTKGMYYKIVIMETNGGLACEDPYQLLKENIYSPAEKSHVSNHAAESLSTVSGLHPLDSEEYDDWPPVLKASNEDSDLPNVYGRLHHEERIGAPIDNMEKFQVHQEDEPHHNHLKTEKRKYQTVMASTTYKVILHFCAAEYLWLIGLFYACDILNCAILVCTLFATWLVIVNAPRCNVLVLVAEQLHASSSPSRTVSTMSEQYPPRETIPSLPDEQQTVYVRPRVSDGRSSFPFDPGGKMGSFVGAIAQSFKDSDSRFNVCVSTRSEKIFRGRHVIGMTLAAEMLSRIPMATHCKPEGLPKHMYAFWYLSKVQESAYKFWKFKNVAVCERPCDVKRSSYKFWKFKNIAVCKRPCDVNVIRKWGDGSHVLVNLLLYTIIMYALYMTWCVISSVLCWKGQSKIKAPRRTLIHCVKYGVLRTAQEAAKLYALYGEIGNTLLYWQDVMSFETTKTKLYDSFKYLERGAPASIERQEMTLLFCNRGQCHPPSTKRGVTNYEKELLCGTRGIK